ncbi:hypothetical protein ACH5RR_002230 [Cinchona calisaya]|uniref:BHLH domain-containing protein n=1 Tax=Cinchona calisaya TaxID=153742 RepID=A0ABD3B711_9GENT
MAEGVGQEDSFVWENESWAFLNSDKSGGSDENPSNKLHHDSNNSNCPTPREAEAGARPSSRKRKARKGKQPATGGDDQVGKGVESDHEMHIWTERERRKKMRSMFSNLQALLPQLPSKADKSTIVDEAVNYIRSLQQTLQKLQKQKLEMLQGLTTINYDHRSLISPNKLLGTESSSREAFLADQGPSSYHQLMTNNPNPLVVPRYPTCFRTWAAPNMVLNVCGDKAQINICCPKKAGLFSAICYFLEKHKVEVLSAHVSSDHYRSMYMIQVHASGALDQFAEAFSLDDIFQLAIGDIMMYMSSLS